MNNIRLPFLSKIINHTTRSSSHWLINFIHLYSYTWYLVYKYPPPHFFFCIWYTVVICRYRCCSSRGLLIGFRPVMGIYMPDFATTNFVVAHQVAFCSWSWRGGGRRLVVVFFFKWTKKSQIRVLTLPRTKYVEFINKAYLASQMKYIERGRGFTQSFQSWVSTTHVCTQSWRICNNLMKHVVSG